MSYRLVFTRAVLCPCEASVPGFGIYQLAAPGLTKVDRESERIGDEEIILDPLNVLSRSLSLPGMLVCQRCSRE